MILAKTPISLALVCQRELNPTANLMKKYLKKYLIIPAALPGGIAIFLAVGIGQ